MTQANAAQAIGVARTPLVAIEQGQRRVRFDELQALSSLYGLSINALLRKEAVHVDLAPRFRKLTAGESSASEVASRLMADLAKAEVELENLLGVQRTAHYPPECPLLPGDVRTQAEQDALELRQWLGLRARSRGDSGHREPKAIGICAARFPGLIAASTMDILRQDTVVDALGSDRIQGAALSVLRTARLRVPDQHSEWVENLFR